MPISEVFNEDNMIGMKRYPDKFFDLAIVDPEYGIGISNNPFRGKQVKKDWDSKTPDDIYFDELFRVSKNQIIWGGNYFGLPATQGFLIWDKVQPHDFSSAMCEYAWSSFQSPAKLIRLHVVTTEKNKIHPTQKPVKLYTWILEKYGICNKCHNEGTIWEDVVGDGGSRMQIYCEWCNVSESGQPKILDTHLGSQSSRIAAYKLGFDFWGWEIDKQYFDEGNERFKKSIAEPLFDKPKELIQSKLL